MNTTAVLIGLFYGVLSVVVCYVVSMITSGLFARPFYRLYARVLIGICSVMLLAPALRWLGGAQPQVAVFGLTLGQYVVMGALGYGVARFNRDYMKKLFLNRSTTAYFTFGTLANAAVVTLAFLHFAVTGAPSWSENGQGFIGAGNYGPLLIMLAAMVFHTDYHLKQSVGDLRRFSRFTFVGYAISFLGLALSMVPYLGRSLGELGVVTSDSPLLQNFFSAQALLIAIIVYAWLVWRYESVPPLFLLLLAVVGEYHVLVTQWVIEAFGPASWGLASLPLFAGIALLDHYFANWDQRKQKSEREEGVRYLLPGTGPSGASHQKFRTPFSRPLRFAMPFRFVGVGLASALLLITLWTRLSPVPDSSAHWLAATFGIYTLFFLAMAVFRREPNLVYISGLLAGLVALLGVQSAGGPMSVAILGVVAAIWGALALFGERGGLRVQWRTPLVDCSLLSAITVTLIVFSRHLLGQDAYHFQAVGFPDAVALGFAALAYAVCAHQYRSRLPVFGVLVAMATAVPPWSAAVGLFATVAAVLTERRVKKENATALEGRVHLFGITKLPMEDVLPGLYVQPLSMGAIPLALLGLMISASHVIQGNFAATILIGAATSALVLMALTRTCRFTWLYIVSLAATYFAVHSIAQGLVFESWPASQAISSHLLVAASLSLFGWIVGTGYAMWCGALLKRVSEDKEAAIRSSRSYYVGLLYEVTGVVAVAILAAVLLMSLSNEGAPVYLSAAAALTAVLFALAASLYRSQLGSYLSLSAFTLATLNALAALDLSRSEVATVVAAIGLSAAAVSCLAWGRQSESSRSRTKQKTWWSRGVHLLEATGLKLWLGPLAIYSLICGFFAVITVLQVDTGGRIAFGLTPAVALTLAMASAAYLLSTRALRTPGIYVVGIALAYAAFHATAALALDQRDFVVQTQLVHLTLAAALTLVSCCVAAICAFAINTRSDREPKALASDLAGGTRPTEGPAASAVGSAFISPTLGSNDVSESETRAQGDEDPSTTWRANREYYAGILQHFAFIASLITLVALAGVVVFGDLASSTATLISILVSLLLAVTFSFLGVIYHSRIQTYCALTAGSLGIHGMATILVPEAQRIAYQTLSVSVSAVLSGVIAWLIVRLQRQSDSATRGLVRGRYECWEKPPLPLVSMDASLWAKPLAHVSIVLAFLGLCLVGRDWLAFHGPRGQIWLTVAPIYLAAAAFFIATKTYRFGWLRQWMTPNQSDQETRHAADWVERGILYVISLVTAGVAIHLTAQLLTLENLPDRLSVSWHLCLSALVALVGWSLAALYTIGCNRQLRTSPDSQAIRQDLRLYGGLLHHVAAVAAVLGLGVACAFGVPPQYLSLPLLGSIGLLILFFGLASLTYRSQSFSYISLLSVGLATLHLSTMAVAVWPNHGSFDLPALAGLSLALVLLASLFSARSAAGAAENRNVVLLPSPWSAALSSPPDSPSAVWAQSLRETSIFYGLVALIALLAHRSFLDGSLGHTTAGTVITFYFVAATFALAARLYDSWLLTYGAAIVVAFSTLPLLIILGEPVAHLGIALSLVAMLFWIAGFVVERYCVILSRRGSEARSSSLARIYERPMIRCSAVLATIAIAHSLLVWQMYGWDVSQRPLVVACALGAVTLLLNARSFTVLKRATKARMLVYLACASITGCCLTATSMIGSFHTLGPSAAITALALGIVGLILIENSRSIALSKPNVADPRLTFGQPISHFASGLSVLAVALAVIPVVSSQLVPAAVTLLISAVVCLLTVRAQRDIRWLYPAVIVGSVGLCCLLESQAGWSLGALAVVALVLMNLLVAFARIIRTHRTRFNSIFGLSGSNGERPFFEWPLVFTTTLLIGQGIYLAYSLLGSTADVLEWPWHWIGLLSAGVFFHVLYLQPHVAYVHLLVGSSVVGVLGICVSSGMMVTPDIALAALALTWGAVAALVNRPMGGRAVALFRMPLESSQRENGEQQLLSWSIGLILSSLAITFPVAVLFRPDFPSVTLTLLMATVAGVVGGFRWRSVHAQVASAILFPIGLVSAAFFYGHETLLQEFGSLLVACLTLAYFAAGRIACQRGEADGRDPFFAGVGTSLINMSYAVSAGVMIAAIVSVMQSSPPTPVALSITLVSSCWLWMAWVSGHEILGYSAVVGFFVAILYLGHALLGIPFKENPLAAFFVIGFSFALYGVNILVSRAEGTRVKVLLRPTYYLALALPIFLVVTIPLEEKTAAAFALLAAGSFYLLIARQSQIRWALYVAAILVNVAIYLWIPAARELTGLYQLYVIPAAITVLIFAQLHRHELNAEVLTSIRLAAAGTILAVSTFEVFFSQDPSLLQFVVVLLLSLAGVAAGIALRIKPFVYAGIAFMVINVAGQLGLQFHREGGVVRAIILIAVGLLVLSAMIFFNIHRERILRQYRGFVADKHWE